MNKQQRWIWVNTITFLRTFQHIRLGNIPVAPLLLRDFQKLLTRHYPHAYKKNMTALAHPVQEALQRLLPLKKPNRQRSGITLIRAELYGILPKRNQERFILLAHHKKELNRIKMKSMRQRTIYLPHVTPSKRAINHVNQTQQLLARKLCSRSLPELFKTGLFKRWMMRRTRQACIQMGRIDTLFHIYKIKRVIYGSTVNRHGVLATTYAQLRRIPTVNIQHGILGSIGHFPINASLNLMWGPSHQAYIEQYGKPYHAIELIRPLFVRDLSQLQQRQLPEPENQNRRLCILVAMQPFSQTYNVRLIQRLELAGEQLPFPIQFIYKLHPDQQRAATYQRLLRHSTSKIVRHGERTLAELFRISDAIITPFSTVGIEALLHNKPVIHYGKPYPLYYLKEQPPFVQKAKDIKAALIELRDGLMEQPILERSVSAPPAANDGHQLEIPDHCPTTRSAELKTLLPVDTLPILSVESAQYHQSRTLCYRRSFYLVKYRDLKDADYYDKAQPRHPVDELWEKIIRFEKQLS